MIASLNADLFKTRKRTANWILLGVFLAVLILLVYVVRYLVLKNPPARFESAVPPHILIRETFPENLVAQVLSGMPTIGAAIMLILGALSTASEYGWGTVQTILVQRPGRSAVLGGKIVGLTLVSLLVTIVLFAAAAVTSFILANFDGTTSSWPSPSVIVRGLGAGWLVLGVYTAFGTGLGVLLRSTAGAIGAGLTYVFVIEGILAALFANTDGVKELLKFLPGESATAVTRTFPYTFANLQRGAAPLIGGTRGTVTLLVYVVAFVGIALVFFQRRDVGA